MLTMQNDNPCFYLLPISFPHSKPLKHHITKQKSKLNNNLNLLHHTNTKQNKQLTISTLKKAKINSIFEKSLKH
jgi:hypothetical protein